MTQDDFDRLQTLLASRAGFRLTRDRIHLAEHRLGPVARREGFDTVEALLGSLWVKPVASLAWSVIEAMLNAETWFRRDRAPFDTFANEILPAIGRVRPGGLVRIWSAGCSTGQEPYSLAMAGLDSRANIEIVATDLSQRAVDRARTGVFTGFEIQRGLSATSMLQWFEPVEEQWRARQTLRESVRFARANLLDEVSDAGRFDVIFCRNVVIYFDKPTQRRLFDRFAEMLVPDGHLFVGHSESLHNVTDRFRHLGRTIHRRVR
jgi:chemotaxis protein methyltransferase CheR